MSGSKRYPSMVWLLVQAAIVFCYTSTAFCKPYRQKIHQEDNKNNQQNNKTILQVTNNPVEHSAHLDKDILDPSLNSRPQLLNNNRDKFKTNAGAPLLHESVIFKAIVSNINVLTLQEENSSSNGLLPKHFTEAEQQEHKDANGSSSSHQRPSKAHLKWDGHVVAAPLKYDPQVSNFETPKKVSDTVSTSKMVLSLLTAAVALGSICLTVAIFQCCCRRKRSSDDEDEGQIDNDQCNKEKAAVRPVDTHEQQSVETESSEKNVCIQQADTPVDTPLETTTDGETVQKDSEEKEEEEQEVSVKDKIKAFETQALKPFTPENTEQHRTLIKRPHSRAITDGESEALSASTTLIMGQVFRKRADTEKCQRKETVSAAVNVKKDDDYFGMIGRETEVLKSYRRAPAPRNRNKATKALYRKTMPNMDSAERSNMEISMSDWESTVQSFHQTESPFGRQESKKKIPIPLPLPKQNAKDEVDNKLEDSTDAVEKTETKTEGSMIETVSATDTEKLGSAQSTENNTPDMTSSSGDEASQGEETKIKEEMKEEETNKEEKEEEKVEVKKEEEEKVEVKEEEEKKLKDMEEKEEEGEKLKKEEKEKQKKEAEEKEEKKLKEDEVKEGEKVKEEKKLKEGEKVKEKMKDGEKLKEEKKVKKEEKKMKREEEKVKREEEKVKEEELKKEKKNKNEEPEKKEKEKETEVKKEKEKQLKKEKELKREKDEMKREKEELNKEELKKGKELEKEAEKTENIFFQIDPTAEPTAAKLVKRDSGHESSETSVQMRESKDDSPKNEESSKSKRHLSHLDRTTMFMLPGQKPEDHMSLMLSLKEKLNDKKEKNELDADTDTKMDVDPEQETETLEVPEC